MLLNEALVLKETKVSTYIKVANNYNEKMTKNL